ncbi:hypothetical protein [Bradyrhizobium sp. JYMT SZCCT0428]|uniref:hypothetical protein n=1 Tax=Bradyrhizobium sp. JYMT SZCCT0428 TaxID=2807673 RepID=UPI001BAC9D16|nr:hypothetical protein [Bradyrhizobium sp. JYMT SZCCT0428]MBR1156810.1 hypothetical protein [Bradyrhizobium sp. JYMT SZCCT0428]
MIDEMTYEEYVRAHSLPPLVSVKKACEIASVGHTKFYELVKQGVFTLIPNGSRRNIPATQLYQHHCTLIAKAKASRVA